MGKNFAKDWGMGWALLVPVVLVSCIIANLLGALFGVIAKNAGPNASNMASVVLGAILGAIASVIACKFMGLYGCEPFEIKGSIRVLTYPKVFAFLLPCFATFVAFLVVLILISASIFILSSVIAASMSHWLIYWIALLYMYKNISCDKCHCVFSLYNGRTTGFHSGEGETTKYHSGSGVIGHVYDKNGNKVGDVKGDTSYTTTHRYFWSVTDRTYVCKCCGASKTYRSRNSHSLS